MRSLITITDSQRLREGELLNRILSGDTVLIPEELFEKDRALVRSVNRQWTLAVANKEGYDARTVSKEGIKYACYTPR